MGETTAGGAVTDGIRPAAGGLQVPILSVAVPSLCYAEDIRGTTDAQGCMTRQGLIATHCGSEASKVFLEIPVHSGSNSN